VLTYKGKCEQVWIIMLKEHDGPTEPAEKRAERKWRNNQLRQKIKAGKIPPVVVDPRAPPDVATVLENKAKRRPGGFERKFLKEIRAMLDERKQENYRALAAHVHHYRRRLMLEKLRRLELAQREDAERENAERQNADEGQMDLFA
jgi:hypothetical protein